MRCVFVQLILLFILVSSCRPRQVDPIGFVQYVQDPKHGLSQEVIKEGLTYKVQYQPASYLAIKANSPKTLTKTTLNNEAKEYSDHLYFMLQISSHETMNSLEELLKDKKGDIQADSAMNYLRFYAQKDMKLIVGMDTVDCALYHMENPGLASAGMRINTVFYAPRFKQEDIADITFLFKKDLIRNEPIWVNFSGKDLVGLPNINF